MQIDLLGPLSVRVGGEQVEVGPPKRRLLLLRLLVEHGRAVPVHRLCEDLWQGAPPTGAVSSVQAHVSRLRAVLEPQRTRRGAARTLTSEPGGYALRVPAEALDTVRFEQAVSRARELLARGRTEAAREEIDRALEMWRGPALADAIQLPFAAAEAARLEAAGQAARELRITILLALGEHEPAVAAAEALTAHHPLRETLWELLMRGLYLSGRPAEALHRYQKVRKLLAEELGLDPGPALRETHLAILRHDPALLRPLAGARTEPAARPAAPAWPATSAPPLEPPRPATAPRPVGRAEELAALDGVLGRAASGQTAWAVLCGDPGIGKTALAEAVASHAADAGFTVARARCGTDGRAPGLPTPYGAVHQLHRELLEQRWETLSEQHRPPAHPSHPSPSGQAVHRPPLPRRRRQARGPHERSTLLDEAVRELRTHTAHAPLLCVIDDAQWLDRASTELVTLLAEHLHDAPVAVLCLVRSPAEECEPLDELLVALARRGAERLDLSPLTVADVEELLRRQQDDPATAAALHRRTGGNPFFLTELLRLPPDRRVGAGAELPISVHSMLHTRLAKLPAPVRRMLQTAAVAGEFLDTDVLSHLLGIPAEELLDRIDEAIAARVLTWEPGAVPQQPGRFRFGHALVREAALAGLTPVHRQWLHTAVARALTDLPGHHPSDAAAHRAAATPALPAPPAARTGTAGLTLHIGGRCA